MHISVSNDIINFKKIQVDNLTELAEIIQHFNWSAGTFVDGYRNKENFISADCIGLDIDEGCTLAEAEVLFKDYEHIISPSKSHQIEKNGIICDRFRVILFFTETISSSEVFENTWYSLQSKYPFIDKACKDASRFYYPSGEPISINANFGLQIKPVLVSFNKPLERTQLTMEASEAKLSTSTLNFLVKGAPRGSWNASLFKASKDWHEQGLDQADLITKVEQINGVIDSVDMRTIESAYSKEPKYLPRAMVEELEETSLIEDMVQDLTEVSAEAIDYLQNKELVKGEPTDIPGLDALIGGKRLGEITALTAVAKAGKSTLTHYMMHKWLKRGLPIGYATREMHAATEVIPNLLSLSFGHNAWKEDVSKEMADAYRAEIASWPLYFAKGYGYLSFEEFKSFVLTLKAKGVNHFVLDHLLYSMANPEDFKEVSLFMRNLKQFVIEEQIHLDLIIQPKNLQAGESLNMGSLRGGSNIAQAINTLLMLERVPDHKNIAKLTVKMGRSKLLKEGHIHLKYTPETTQFEEMEFVPDAVDKESFQSNFADLRLIDNKRIPY